MKTHTHQKSYYYTFKSGYFIYTAKPKRKGAKPKSVKYIQRMREALKKENDRVNALINSPVSNIYETLITRCAWIGLLSHEDITNFVKGEQ